MLTSLRQQTRLFWADTAVLIIALPALILPERWPTFAGLALLLLITVWLARWWLTHEPLPPSPFNLVLLLWSLMLIVAILVTADPEWTAPKAAGLILGLAMWRYCLIYINTAVLLKWVMLAYFLFGLGMIALGLLNIAWLPKVPLLDSLVFWFSEQVGLGQIRGTPEEGAVHSNQIAGTLLFFLPLTAVLLIWWRPTAWRRLILAGLAGFFGLGLLIMLLSQSRAGWAGTAVGLAILPWFYALTHREHPRWRLVSWLLPTGALLATAVALPFLWPRLEAIWSSPNIDTAVGNLNTLAFRQVVWQWGLTAVQDFPFTGTGLGSFRAVVTRLYPLPIYTDIGHAHNIFLQVALDVGLPGLIIYLALLGLMGITSWHIVRARHPLYTPLALGFVANLLALHTYGLLDTLALGSKTGLFFWLMLGLLTTMFHQSQMTAKHKERQGKNELKASK